jgi:hypothetical protein
MTEIAGIGYFVLGLATAGLLTEVARVALICMVVRFIFRKELAALRAWLQE